MSEDSIATIWEWIKKVEGKNFDGIRPSVGAVRRMMWLISELEACGAEVKRLKAILAHQGITS